MPLIDALRSGVDLVNAANKGVGDAAAARYAFSDAQLRNEYQKLINQYYGPEHQAAIDYQNITNQYLPEKLRLGNQYQGLVNADYHADKQSEIDARNAETQFIPLKYAIQAENAIRNNTRFGGSYQYLKSVADMPADQKAIWMANPENYAQYQAEIQNLHSSMANTQAQGGTSNLITPALLKRVGLESLSQDIIGAAPATGVVVSGNKGGLAAPLNANQGGLPAQQNGAPPVVVNVPNQMTPITPQASQMMQQGGMAAPFPGMTPMGGPPVMPPQGGMTPMGAPPIMPPQPQQAPPQAAPQAQAPQVPRAPSNALPANTPPLSQGAAAIAAKDGVSPVEANEVANDAKNPTLTNEQRQQLGFQMVANKKTVGQVVTNRALGAVTFEKVIGDNQDRFAPAFENSAKYAGLLGAGKLTLDQFRKEHPQEYADYIWVTNDLIPNFGQNIRVMEGLASTDKQREALAEMYKSALSWKSDPRMAVKNINRTIDLFKSQAKAAMAAAQPVYPGVLEKLYGLKDSKADYIGPGRMTPEQQSALKGMSDAELMARLKGVQ